MWPILRPRWGKPSGGGKCVYSLSKELSFGHQKTHFVPFICCFMLLCDPPLGLLYCLLSGILSTFAGYSNNDVR